MCALPDGVKVVSMSLQTYTSGAIILGQKKGMTVTAEINTPSNEPVSVCYAVRDLQVGGSPTIAVGVVGIKSGETKVTQDDSFYLSCIEGINTYEIKGLSSLSLLEMTRLNDTSHEPETAVFVHHVERWPSPGQRSGFKDLSSDDVRSNNARMFCQVASGPDNPISNRNDPREPPIVNQLPVALAQLATDNNLIGSCDVRGLSWSSSIGVGSNTQDENPYGRCHTTCSIPTGSVRGFVGLFDSISTPQNSNNSWGFYLASGAPSPGYNQGIDGFYVSRHRELSQTRFFNLTEPDHFVMISSSNDYTWAFGASNTENYGAFNFPANMSGVWELDMSNVPINDTTGPDYCSDLGIHGKIFFYGN